MKFSSVLPVLLGGLLAFSTSSYASSTPIEGATFNIKQSFDKRALAQQAQRALSDETVLNEALKLLQANPVGLSMDVFVNKLSIKNNRQDGLQRAKLKELGNLATNQCFRNSRISNDMLCQNYMKSGNLEVPELWLFKPKHMIKALTSKEVLFAYPPAGDEDSWTHIEAFDRFGNVVFLDAKVAPEVPVIVVETQGGAAFDIKVKIMNDALRNAGLQSLTSINTPIKPLDKNMLSAQALAEDTTKMTQIHLDDDKEPWIKGAAEIYMITSGVKKSGDKAELKITPLHYLDEDGKNYYPNQLVLFWNDYAYNVANIQLWEDDGDSNYQQLVQALIQAVGRAGGVFGLPELTAVTEIAAIIVEAMPSNWFSDDDDFVDTCYTIEKNQQYSNHNCAAGNARISLEPFTINSN
ncbi:DUF3103 family protein [Agarilytica rhodophyticola]|uniref:DUF3103 family protein n=1 Tax=Agarilytica rhodophyticola TaxID=1737490 RepID=UPI000B341873|nr:DUF3103 family protein [Agarilytica rhodophyticola]